jgi:hypothetical protein
MKGKARIEVRKFDGAEFRRAVVEACGCCDIEPAPQVRYLENYLRRDLNAATLVIEREYTDRHYMEEFATYYSKLLHAPSPRTTRLHLFDDTYEPAAVEAMLQGVSADAHATTEVNLNGAYLGFVVVRPFEHAPIGRTVLKHVSEGKGRRDFSPARLDNTVHLAGLNLSVQGLPFQQQDQGVGACATTALWSMLASTFRQNGQRPPPPAEITTAAHLQGHRNRRFPALDGLTPEQMVAAIDHFRFTPALFNVESGDAFFLLALQCFLRSGFPVLIHVADTDFEYGHAICAVGLSADTESDDQVWASGSGPDESGVVLRFRSVRRIYIHDDQLGPYARCKFGRRNQEDGHSVPTLQIALADKEESWAEQFGGPMRIFHALVALYPKIRLSVRELIDAAVEWSDLVSRVVNNPLVELKFQLGGAFLRSLMVSERLPPDRCAAFALAADLSRYVGVVSLVDEAGTPFCDVLIDATDIRRNVVYSGALALVPYSDAMTAHFHDLARTGLFPADILIA